MCLHYQSPTNQSGVGAGVQSSSSNSMLRVSRSAPTSVSGAGGVSGGGHSALSGVGSGSGVGLGGSSSTSGGAVRSVDAAALAAQQRSQQRPAPGGK